MPPTGLSMPKQTSDISNPCPGLFSMEIAKLMEIFDFHHEKAGWLTGLHHGGIDILISNLFYKTLLLIE